MGGGGAFNHRSQVTLLTVGAATASHTNRLRISEQRTLRELNIDGKSVKAAPLMKYLLTIPARRRGKR